MTARASKKSPASAATATAPKSVGYFCMEYGLDVAFPIYAGGLGILAGDHMKSVGDLHVPLVGIGLLWNEGYTRQVVSSKGELVDEYPVTSRDALRRVDGRVEVTVRGKQVPLRAWKVERYITSELYLLEPEREDDRWITQRLYGGDGDDRLAQEVVLGVGGVRMLDALDRAPDVYHFNEGHAVFAGLELLHTARFGGKTLADRIAKLRPHVVFTTHTPVPAGNEVHDLATMREVSADCGFSDADLKTIGGAPFSMTVAGLRLAHQANGVAELHGETARKMWKGTTGAAPIIAITIGVHVPSWQDARIRAALVPEKAKAAQDAELWAAHAAMKREMVVEVERRTGVMLDDTSLVIGFARRAATYKRADLILGDTTTLEEAVRSRRAARVLGQGAPARHRRQGDRRQAARGAEAVPEARRVRRELRHDGRRAPHARLRYLVEQPEAPARGERDLRHEGGDERRAEPVDTRRLVARRSCVHGKTGWKIGDPDPKDDAFDDGRGARRSTRAIARCSTR